MKHKKMEQSECYKRIVTTTASYCVLMKFKRKFEFEGIFTVDMRIM